MSFKRLFLGHVKGDPGPQGKEGPVGPQSPAGTPGELGQELSTADIFLAAHYLKMISKKKASHFICYKEVSYG